MAQDKIKIDNVEIWQPDEELVWNYETTYTEDSGNVQTGYMHETPMFTKESFSYKSTEMPAEEATKILQLVTGRSYVLHAYNPYFNKWMDMKCYTGKGSLNIKTVVEDGERISSLSFNMIDKVPLEKQK